MEGPGFIKIKYGKDEERILNTWCPSHLLLKHCVKHCYGEEEAEKYKKSLAMFDLIDTNGQLGQLASNPYLYAHQLIYPRETYVLIKVESKEDENDRYVSLLHNVGKLYPKVKAKLDELSQYKVSGKVGARWTKLKTVSRLSSMVKTSARSTGNNTPPLEKRGSMDKRGSNLSIDKAGSEISESSGSVNVKPSKKTAKDTARKKKNSKS